MVDQLSPLQPVWQPGAHGNIAGGTGVVLSETRPGSIIQIAAWRGSEKSALRIVQQVSGLELHDGAGAGVALESKAAFGFAPGRFLVVDQAEGLGEAFKSALSADIATVTDLSHGRTAIRISGAKSEWVLAKFFAIDFSLAAFLLEAGRSTVHHDIFALIHRTAPDQFDLYVYRSFARAFWKALCHASEEVGYEVK